MRSLEIKLLGDFRLSYGGELLAAVTPRMQALLAYLILHQDAPQSRQQLAYVFWPDSEESQARTNLRRELHHLRKELPAADRFLRVDAKTVQWRPDTPFSLDVRDFETAAGQVAATIEDKTLLCEAAAAAARLYGGTLLPALYDDWLIPERERLQEMAVSVLEQLTDALETQRKYAAALPYAQRLLELEPLHEANYQRLMRLQALRGDRTAALQTYHRCVALLEQELAVTPSAATEALYRRLRETANWQPSQPEPTDTSLIGRLPEWETLLTAWHSATQRGVAFAAIVGEAGIGKTKLAEALLGWAQRQGVVSARARSYAAEGRLAYAPVRDWLRSEAFKPTLAGLESIWLSEVSRLLPELLSTHPNLPRPEPLTESWQRQRLFEALARTTLAAPQPILLFIDDLQWCDLDTLEWLHYLLRFDANARLLIMGTIRSEELDDNPPLRTLLLELRKQGWLTELELGPLDSAESAELAARVTGSGLNPEQQSNLFAKTEGHPLFVVESARAGLSIATSPENGDSPRQLPPRVQAVIALRLAQLSSEARELVQLAATMGRNFSFAVLEQASDVTEETLINALDELWQRHIVREQTKGSAEAGPGTPSQDFDFSHDLLREVAYAEVSPIKRRLLHGRVARALEHVYANSLDGISARLAAHFEQAGQPLKAIAFYERAADVARELSASEEEIRLLRRALSLLAEQAPSAERDQQELTLQYALSAPLNAVKGYPSVELEEALRRVRSLGETLGQTGPVAQSLAGLLGVYFVRGDIRRALEFGEAALVLAEQETSLLAENHLMVGGALVSLGKLNRGHDHFEKALARHHPTHKHRAIFGSEPDVFARAWQAYALWLRGYPDRARQRSQEALARANTLQHPYSLVVANAYAAISYQLQGDIASSQSHAQTASKLCDRYGFAYYGDWGTIISGWVTSQQGFYDQGIAEIRRGLASLRAIGAESRRPYYLSLLADAHLNAGQLENAQAILDAALSTATQNYDLWWSPELHRLKGISSAPALSEAHFKRALDIARQQESKSLELRAAVSLGRLWQSQDKRDEAKELVEGVYSWFTEGFDTPDLQAAKVFLERPN